MQIVHLIHNPKEPLPDVEPCVMALGFFDGVHIGHQRVIRTAKQIASNRRLKLAVMTFDPHPKEVISEGKVSVDCLTPLPMKGERLKELDVDILYVIRFDRNFAALSPEAFTQRYLVGLKAEYVVAGYDFTYGNKGVGNMKRLEKDGLGRFEVTIVPKVEREGRKISSTLIRQLISYGEVNSIPNYLGRWYEIRGKVCSFLSENIQNSITIMVCVEDDYMLPKPGVYRIRAQIEDRMYEGFCNHTSGLRQMEVQLFDCPKDVEWKQIRLQWIEQIPLVKAPFLDTGLQVITK